MKNKAIFPAAGLQLTLRGTAGKLLPAICFGAALLLAGCFSATDEQVAAGTELITTPALPEETLLLNATEAYDRGLYSLAKDSWTQLRDSYPSGPYASLAELKIADSSFFAGDYPAAVAGYEEFLRLHPQHEAAPYVQFQIGRSYQEQSRGDDRDPTPVKQALNAYEQVLSKYPDSAYVVQADLRIAECDQVIEAHQRLIADFYERSGKPEAAKKRYAELEAQKRQAKVRRTKKIQEQTLLRDQALIGSEDLPEGDNSAEAPPAAEQDQLMLTAEGAQIPAPPAGAAVPQKAAAESQPPAGPAPQTDTALDLRPPRTPRPVAVGTAGRDAPSSLGSNELLADLRCERIAGAPVVTLLYRSAPFAAGKQLPRWTVVEQGINNRSNAVSSGGGAVKTLNKQLALPTAGIQGLAAQEFKCDLEGVVRAAAFVRPVQTAGSAASSAYMTLSFPDTIWPSIVPLDRPYRLLLLFVPANRSPAQLIGGNPPVAADGAYPPAAEQIPSRPLIVKPAAAVKKRPIATIPIAPVEERDF